MACTEATTKGMRFDRLHVAKLLQAVEDLASGDVSDQEQATEGADDGEVADIEIVAEGAEPRDPTADA